MTTDIINNTPPAPAGGSINGAPAGVKLGIVSALEGELAGVLISLAGTTQTRAGERTYHAGDLGGVPVVAVAGRVGKVAAAVAASTLILHHQVTHMLVVGVAGSTTPRVSRGDAVVARRLIQHDLDASPLFPALEVPLTGRAAFVADDRLSSVLFNASVDYLAGGLEADFPDGVRARFGLGGGRRPKALRGDVMTGDRFIADAGQLDDLTVRAGRQAEALGIELDLAAIEMEGAAVAQVCREHEVPFAVLRIISDSANDDAAQDFAAFLREIAPRYTAGIVQRFAAGLATRG